MKCPNCLIYFDDEEKACPMCGRKRATMGAGTASRASTPSVAPLQGDVYRKTMQPSAQPMQGSSQKANYQTGNTRVVYSASASGQAGRPKRSHKAGIIAVIIWVVVMIVSIGAVVGDNSPRQEPPTDRYSDDTFNGYENYDDDYDALDIAVADVFGEGFEVQKDDVHLGLVIDSEDEYTLTLKGADWSITEAGWMSVTDFSDDEDSYYFKEGVTQPENYECYYIYMESSECNIEGNVDASYEWDDAYEYGRTMVLYKHRETGKQMLYDIWSENGQLFMGEQYIELN